METETIEGIEIWKNADSVLLVIISRNGGSGLYTGWTAQTFLADNEATINAAASMATDGRASYEELSGLASRDAEFRSHRAATKWAKRLLSQVVDGSSGMFKPKAGWTCRYEGPKSIQAFSASAERTRIADKVKKLEKEIAEAANIDGSSMTNTEYRAHRRRKINLKVELAKLHGGDNA